MDEQQRAAEHIVQRYFATHVLVSLPDLLERYPCDPEWLRVRLEAWAQGGRIVRVEATGEHPTVQWSLPDHVEQVQHTTLVINRREVQPVAAARFADFLLRWQRLHPETRGQDVTDLQEVLQRLQGVRQPAPLWERVLLPSRFHSYQSRWLDECLESGDWLWVGSAAEEADLAVAFVLRAELAQLPPLTERNEPLQGAEEVVHAALQQRGALFVTDLSQAVKLPPSTVRAALWSLVRRGLVTNDRYDAVRHGEHVAPPESATALRRMRARQLLTPRPEGRWALLPWQPVESEVQALHVARLLLQRHGIVAREVALRERWLPPWRVLYEVLSRLELAGEVRRGYFVEGLSGAQFALPEASRLLAEPVPPTAPAVLVHSQDPANVYGSGGLFDLPNTTFQRRPGNWLVLCGGEPVLIVEQHGKQLTSSPRAAAPALAAAVGELPRLLQLDRELSQRHKLTVSLWNGQPIRGSAGEPLLEQVGFVADYQDLTLYGGWK